MAAATGRERVLSVAVTRDGRTAATGPGGGEGKLRLWDISTGTSRELEGHTARVWKVAFNPRGDLLASASWDGTVRLWNVASGETIRILDGLPRFYALAFSDDGTMLAAGGGEGEGRQDRLGQILVWNVDQLPQRETR